MANIFYIAFSPFNMPAEKFRIKQAAKLKKYAKEIDEKINKIPEEKLLDPKLSIVGPALEASKYYIDEEEIRLLFTNLIASSMNSDLVSGVHHSFVETIKQISPLDAQNLKTFSTNNKPIVNYIFEGGGKALSMKKYVYLENDHCNDIDLQCVSISNLERLGILSTRFDSWFDEEEYEKHKTHEYFVLMTRLLAEVKNNPLSTLPAELNYAQSILESTKITIHKGVAEITPYGESFKKVCIIDPS